MLPGRQIHQGACGWRKPHVTLIHTWFPINNNKVTVSHVSKIKKYGIYSILRNFKLTSVRRLALSCSTSSGSRSNFTSLIVTIGRLFLFFKRYEITVSYTHLRAHET